MSINREIRFITAGNSTSKSQVFYNNCLFDSSTVATSFYSFYKPQFYTYGGTLDYFSQDPYAIFTNLITPPIRFIFTANTESLSGDSYFIHEIYRLDYDTYRLFSDNQIESSQTITSVSNLNNSNSSSPSQNLVTKQLASTSSVKKGGNPIPQPEKLYGYPLTSKDITTIQSFFRNPILVITASTSAITSNVYDLVLSQYVKQVGMYKSELFLDKSQYFINTTLVTNVEMGKQYLDFVNIKNKKLVNNLWNDVLQLSATNSYDFSISSGPFSGISVIGNYFTYFTVPDKPVLEYPIMSGALTTFTPEFRWSNGDKADSFIVQVNYNTGDTGFTGTIYNYPVDKTAENSQILTNTLISLSAQTTTTKTIYNFQLSVRTNSSFIYRVGNSKELIDVFNIRRNVVTFTDFYNATSQLDPIKVNVVSETDSPFIDVVAGFSTPPSLDYESQVSEFTLSGTISGSTVTGATMQLLFPNSSFVTMNTDSLGNYSFSGLEVGNYTITTNYRGYEQDIRSLYLTGDTILGFKLKLLWGDNIDTWGSMAGNSYF